MTVRALSPEHRVKEQRGRRLDFHAAFIGAAIRPQETRKWMWAHVLLPRLRHALKEVDDSCLERIFSADDE